MSKGKKNNRQENDRIYSTNKFDHYEDENRTI